MVAQAWHPEVKSTARRRRLRAVAARLLTTLIALAIFYMAVWGVAVGSVVAKDAKLDSQLGKAMGGAEGNTALVSAIAIVLIACAALMWLERVRLGSAESTVVERRLEAERDGLELILRERLAAEYEKLDAWKSEQVSTMYQTVLDQQARGLLPCPNCHGEHRKSA